MVAPSSDEAVSQPTKITNVSIWKVPSPQPIAVAALVAVWQQFSRRAHHCYQWGLVGPPWSYAIMTDPNFVYGDCWTFALNAWHDSTNTKGVLDDTGSISQAAVISGNYSAYEVVVDVTVVQGSSQGTERMILEIVRSGATDHIATFTPNSTSTNYSYLLSDYYDNQTVTLRISS